MVVWCGLCCGTIMMLVGVLLFSGVSACANACASACMCACVCLCVCLFP